MNKKSFSVRYRLNNINIIKFYFNNLNNDKIETDKLSSEFSVGFNINNDKEIITIRIGVKIKGKETEQSDISELLVNYDYHVIGLKNIEQNDDKLKMPDEFLLSIIAISFSTTRGIFYEKCARTCLSNFILPIVNPKDFLRGKKK
ncbi:MAG: hypothetical protein R6V04_07810 [bacterium]